MVSYGTALEVFAVDIWEGAGVGNEPSAGVSSAARHARLRSLSTLSLFGVVESLTTLPAPAGVRSADAIVATFREAKAVVLDWDPEANELRVSSMHSMEDVRLAAGKRHFPRPPLALADPEGRCAACVALSHKLAVLPAVGTLPEDRAAELALLGDEAVAALFDDGWGEDHVFFDGVDGVVGGAEAGVKSRHAPLPSTAAAASSRPSSSVPRPTAAVGNAHVLSLDRFGVTDVLAAAFLHRCSRPTLALLHEPEPTAPGLLRDRKDTCQLVALTLDPSRRAARRAWVRSGLPSDAAAVAAAPDGSVLVLCLHAIVIVAGDGPGGGASARGAASSTRAAVPPRGVVLSRLALAGDRPPPPPLDAAAMAMVEATQEGASEEAARVAKEHLEPDPRTASAMLATLDASKAHWDLEVTGDARVAWATSNVAVVALPGGAVLGLALGDATAKARERRVGGASAAGAIGGAGGASHATQHPRVFRLGAAPAPTALCGLGGELAFLASAQGNSLLLALWERSKQGQVEGASIVAKSADPQTPARPSQPSGDRSRSAGMPPASAPFPLAGRRHILEADAATAGEAGEARDAGRGLGGGAGVASAVAALAAAEAEDTAGGADVRRDGRGAPLGADKAGGGSRGRTSPRGPGDLSSSDDDSDLDFLFDDEEDEEDGGGTGGKGGGGLGGVSAGGEGGGARRSALKSRLAQERRLALAVEDALPNPGAARDVVRVALPNQAPFMVSAAGSGRAGALGVISEGLAVDVFAAVPVPGALGAWTLAVKGAGGDDEDDASDAATELPYHDFLLLATPKGTTVLSTGEELTEVSDVPGFDAGARTVEAGVCGGRGVQVVEAGVRLLAVAETGSGAASAQSGLIPAKHALLAHAAAMDEDGPAAPDPSPAASTAIVAADGAAPVASAHVTASAVVLLCSDGRVGVLVPQREAGKPPPAVGAPAAALVSVALPEAATRGVSAACVFEDRTGWLGAAGDAHVAVVTAQGTLHVVHLESSTIVFTAHGLAEGDPVLRNEAPKGEGLEPAAPSPYPAPPPHRQVTDVAFEGFLPARTAGGAVIAASPEVGASTSADRMPPYPPTSPPGTTFVSVLRADGSHSFYVAYFAPRARGFPRKPALRRLSSRLVPPALPEAMDRNAAMAIAAWNAARASGAPPAAMLPHLAYSRTRRLVRFDQVGEDRPWNGIAVLGLRPHVLVAARGRLLPHPVWLPPGSGTTTGFAAFHNPNCPLGLVLCTASDVAPAAGVDPPGLRICGLPPSATLDAAWPAQRVTLGATPLRVAFHAASGCVAALVEREDAPYPGMPAEESGSEPHAAYAYALADAAARAKGTAPRGELRAFAPGSWRLVGSAPLEPLERGCALAALSLRDEGDGGAIVPVLAVGAALPFGEDYPCTGRVALYVVGDASEGDGRSRLRLLCHRTFRGPVTALRAVDGLLMVATGSRIEACALRSKPRDTSGADETQATSQGDPLSSPRVYSIERTAFYDGSLLVCSMQTIKNFILTGSIRSGLEFVRYAAKNRALGQLAKDFDRVDVLNAEFVLAGPKLHLLAADASATIRMLSYAPSHPQSWGGRRLVPWYAKEKKVMGEGAEGHLRGGLGRSLGRIAWGERLG